MWIHLVYILSCSILSMININIFHVNIIVIGLILGVEICVLPMSHKYIVKYIGFDLKNIIM
jgi:hypothetical protein